MLRETGPDGTLQQPQPEPESLRRVGSPPDIQDLGGLLETEPGPPGADGCGDAVVDAGGAGDAGELCRRV